MDLGLAKEQENPMLTNLSIKTRNKDSSKVSKAREAGSRNRHTGGQINLR